MADEEELYFANLDEFVNDEDKIVGYFCIKWYIEKALHVSFWRYMLMANYLLCGCFVSGHIQMVESYVVGSS